MSHFKKYSTLVVALLAFWLLPLHARAVTDLSFLLDASGSISSSEFILQQEGYKNAVAQLGVDETVRISVIYFGSSAHIELEPTPLTFGNTGAIDAALSITKSGGGTNMSSALALARNTLQGATNAYVFLSTDGYPNNDDATRIEADALKQQGVELVPIGVGIGSSGKLFLDEIASNPPVETPANFTEFGQVIMHAVASTMITPSPAGTYLGPATGSHNASGSIADPINTATGNYYYQHADISILGRGMSIDFIRTYNAQAPVDGPLGYGWVHPYSASLTDGSDGTVTIRFGDGHEEYYEDPEVDGSYSGLYPGMSNELLKLADGSFEFTNKNQSRIVFDANGRLSVKEDRNGNAIAFAYDSNDNLITITDSSGRIVTLTYDGSNRIVQLGDPIVRTISYSYDANGDLVTATDANGHSESYTYDDQHRMTQILDRRSNVLVDNTYDAENRVVSQRNGRGYETTLAYDTPDVGDTTVTDATGASVSHHHDVALRLVSVPDGLGNRTSYRYDLNNNRISALDKSGYRTNYTYDERGNMLSKTAPLGNITTLSYDIYNQLFARQDALGNVTSFTHGAGGNLLSMSDALDNTTSTTYNANGQPLTVTNPRGIVTSFSYDSQGSLSFLTDALDGVIRYTYDLSGRRTSETDANGNMNSFSYDDNSNLLSITDSLGNVITRIYDENDNLMSVLDALGNVTAYSYNENGLRHTTTDALNNTTTFTYDAADRKTTQIDSRGNVTTYGYDAADRMISLTNALGNISAFSYDANGNRHTVTNPLGSTSTSSYDMNGNLISVGNPMNNTMNFSYDALNRKISETNAKGQTTTFLYDALGRLVSTTDPSGISTQQTYDEVGNRLTRTDMRGNTTLFVYDELNRLIEKTEPLGGVYQYSYDAMGNRISRTDANGATIYYNYDADNRMTAITYPGPIEVIFSYDANGNRTEITNRVGVHAYSYDALNRMLSHTSPFGKTVSYTYDSAGNLATLIYPGGKQVAYQYDALNRMSSVTDWLGGVTTYAYDAAGRLITTTLPNGATATNTYDAASRLTVLSNQKSDASPISSYLYTLDEIGNITSETRSEPLSAVFEEISKSYSYDRENRMLSDGATSYGYDANGNQISQGDDIFSFDEEDRLMQAVVGETTNSYAYDGDGNRLAKIRDGVTTRYVLDTNRRLTNVIAETDSSGNITAYYVYGVGLISQILPDDSSSYYHFDSRGSTAALTDEIGTIISSYTYDEFGNLIGSYGAISNPFKFLGKHGVMDDQNGLNYIRARYFSPTQGRFISKDPAELPKENLLLRNPYAYAKNNPVTKFDINGYWSTSVHPNEFVSTAFIEGMRHFTEVFGHNLYQKGLANGDYWVLKGTDAIASIDTKALGYFLENSAIIVSGAIMFFDILKEANNHIEFGWSELYDALKNLPENWQFAAENPDELAKAIMTAVAVDINVLVKTLSLDLIQTNLTSEELMRIPDAVGGPLGEVIYEVFMSKPESIGNANVNIQKK